MLSGVGIICFASTYAIVLLLEITRLWFRSGLRGLSILGLTFVGFILHTAYLFHRSSLGTAEFSTEQSWYLMAAWVMVIVYIYLACFHPRQNFGVFLLPLILGLIIFAWIGAEDRAAEVQSASRIWGAVHGIGLLLGAASIFLGFMSSLMYFHQSWALKHKRPSVRGLRLPSLEWMQRFGIQMLLVSTISIGVGLFAGTLLNQASRQAGHEGIPWNDPTVLTVQLLFLWLMIACTVALLYRPARRGHMIAWLSVIAFLFLLGALIVGVSGSSAHRVPREPTPAPGISPPAKENSDNDSQTSVIDTRRAWRRVS